MAICRPEAIDDALAREPERGGGRRTGGFLASRGMPRSRGRGRKLPAAVAAQAIEAQPSFG